MPERTFRSPAQPTRTLGGSVWLPFAVAGLLCGVAACSPTAGPSDSVGEGGEQGLDGKDGTNGKNGLDGQDGTACSVVDNGDGTKTIDCEDGTTVTLEDGANGAEGPDGATSLVSLLPIGPGSLCPDGGQLVSVGVDKNGNGTLDAEEVTQTAKLCGATTIDQDPRETSPQACQACAQAGCEYPVQVCSTDYACTSHLQCVGSAMDPTIAQDTIIGRLGGVCADSSSGVVDYVDACLTQKCSVECGAQGCGNGLLDGQESDVDCGGGCMACELGNACNEPLDCASGSCVDGTCKAGGPDPDPDPSGLQQCQLCAQKDCLGETSYCMQDQSCEMHVQCALDPNVDPTIPQNTPLGRARSVCAFSSNYATTVLDSCLIASCSVACGASGCGNGVKDGLETGIDCGGGCLACVTGEFCNQGLDCASQSCVQGKCAAPSCNDNLQNGEETGADCGGACLACPSCGDGILNQNESDIDCGGPCMPCGLDAACDEEMDCLSNVCDQGKCGPPLCSPGCGYGDVCTADTDCLDGVCMFGFCAQPICPDGVMNGAETDIDCGGPFCAPCSDSQACASDSDCYSQFCDGGTCSAPPNCNDGEANGDETDTDCGGLSCDKCVNGKQCFEDADCQSLICVGQSCAAPTCSDGIQNGNETGIDCGGPPCSACQ